MSLFTNHCAGCGKRIDSFATDRSGTLPTVFCNGVCETEYRNRKKFDNEKNIVKRKKSLSHEEIEKKIGTIPWQKYEVENDDNILSI